MNAEVCVGWASADLTPGQPVQVAGQFHMRVSEGVLDPVTATALALSGSGAGGGVVLVSCDLAVISDSLRDAVRAGVRERIPDLDPLSIILNATHTHTAPEVRTAEDFNAFGGGLTSDGLDVDLPAMAPEAYVAFAAARIADAVVCAWSRREPGLIGYGLGHAVVGRNRRSVYEGGVSRMYGDTSAPDFLHVEGCEDHDVNLLATWKADGTLSGLVVNVACPSQVSEHLFEISADYWHDTRVELRRRLGEHLFVLPQCSAAGDQSPHVQVGKPVEDRMLRLAGQTQREALAVRIADAVTSTLPLMEKERTNQAVLRHQGEVIRLPRRRLTRDDVAEAMREVEPLQAEYDKLLGELDADPDCREQPRWYVRLTQCYRRMKWCEGVARRFELEQTEPDLPVEVHAVRLGDIVFATNPFEYYLDFGLRIKTRSAAAQTFLVQLAGNGTYVPTERAVAGKSYGAVPASTPVGPEGGKALVEWTVASVRRLFE